MNGHYIGQKHRNLYVDYANPSTLEKLKNVLNGKNYTDDFYIIVNIDDTGNNVKHLSSAKMSICDNKREFMIDGLLEEQGDKAIFVKFVMRYLNGNITMKTYMHEVTNAQ